MIELFGEDRLKARHLIKRLASPQYPMSILYGHVAGRVFVDREDEPATVLVWETLANVFLAGGPGSDVNRELSRLFNDVIIPQGEKRKGYMFYVAFTEEWADLLPSIIDSRPPILDRRLLYTIDVPLNAAGAPGTSPVATGNRHRIGAHRELLEGMAIIPAGCALREVDSDLLFGDYKNAASLCEEIARQWPKPEDFLQKGHGYCVLQGDTITSWCLTEYPTESACSIGVETTKRCRVRCHYLRPGRSLLPQLLHMCLLGDAL